MNNNIEAFISEITFEDGNFNYWEYEKSFDDKINYPLGSVSSENGKEHTGSHFCEVVGNAYENKELLNV